MFINRHKKEIRVWCRVLFGLYIAALVYFLFFAETMGRADLNRTYHYNLILFKEIKRFIVYREQLGAAAFFNLGGNVLIFVPFGFLLPLMSRKLKGFFNVLLFSLELSLIVETVQLLTKVGSFDVDDLLLNTIGGMLGYGIYAVLQYIRDRRADRMREEKFEEEIWRVRGKNIFEKPERPE